MPPAMMQGYLDCTKKYRLPRMQGWLIELALFVIRED